MIFQTREKSVKSAFNFLTKRYQFKLDNKTLKYYHTPMLNMADLCF